MSKPDYIGDFFDDYTLRVYASDAGVFHSGDWFVVTKGCIDSLPQNVVIGVPNYYIGEFHNGKRHGHGIMIFANHSNYIGEWRDDMPSGQGELYASNTGRKYTGVWDKFTLTTGKCVQDNYGQIIEYDIENGIHEKIITITYKTGDVYRGSAIINRRSGKGCLTSVSGDVYDGDWNNDKRDGRGKTTYANGDYHEGFYRDDHAHGTGKFYCAETQTTYTGKFTAGRKNGDGVIRDQHGRIVQEGEWQKGSFKTGTKRVYDDTNHTVSLLNARDMPIDDIGTRVQLNDKISVIAEQLDKLVIRIEKIEACMKKT